MEAALLSSKKTTFQTPPDVIERVKRVGRIALDPCTSPRNPSGADRYLSLEEGWNGLTCDWSEQIAVHGDTDTDLVFWNPPFGRELPKWVAKGRTEAALGVQQISLTPARPDTAWFTSLALGASEGVFWRGRMTFYDLETGKPALTWSKAKKRFEVMPAPFPVALCYFGANPERFREAFAGTGMFFSEMCR